MKTVLNESIKAINTMQSNGLQHDDAVLHVLQQYSETLLAHDVAQSTSQQLVNMLATELNNYYSLDRH